MLMKMYRVGMASTTKMMLFSRQQSSDSVTAAATHHQYESQRRCHCFRFVSGWESSQTFIAAAYRQPRRRACACYACACPSARTASSSSSSSLRSSSSRFLLPISSRDFHCRLFLPAKLTMAIPIADFFPPN